MLVKVNVSNQENLELSIKAIKKAIDKMILEGRIRFKCGNCGNIHEDYSKNWKGCHNC